MVLKMIKRYLDVGIELWSKNYSDLPDDYKEGYRDCLAALKRNISKWEEIFPQASEKSS